jgi:hypothetical protein
MTSRPANNWAEISGLMTLKGGKTCYWGRFTALIRSELLLAQSEKRSSQAGEN